jgi:GxxExxY protein
MAEENRNAGTELRDSETTDTIIAAAIAVHRELGPGFLEPIYEQALAVEFALRGIAFIRQKPIPLFYRDHQIGEHRLDFLIENKIVVELKAIETLENVHFCNCSRLSKSDWTGRWPNPEFFDHAIDGETSSPRTRLPND